MTTTTLAQVPVSALFAIQEKFARLNRRSARAGRDEMVLKISEPFNLKIWHDGKWYRVPFVNLELQGAPLHFAGHTMLARLEHVQAGAIITGPEAEKAESFRSEPQKCDHCGTNRKRRDTFVLRHEASGALLQVGRSCLQDFLGVSPAKVLAWWDAFQACSLDDSQLGLACCFPKAHDIYAVVAMSIVEIQEGGYSREDTKHNVARRLQRIMSDPRDQEVFSKAKGEAAAAVKWALELDSKTGYLANLKTLCEERWCENRHMGLACSLIVAYRRAKAAKLEQARKAKSRHFGAPNKRAVFELTLLRKLEFDSQFGPVILHVMQDSTGNRAIWKTGKTLLGADEQPWAIGEKLQVRATVKAHEDYRGEAQTVLTRCKVEK